MVESILVSFKFSRSLVAFTQCLQADGQYSVLPLKAGKYNIVPPIFPLDAEVCLQTVTLYGVSSLFRSPRDLRIESQLHI